MIGHEADAHGDLKSDRVRRRGTALPGRSLAWASSILLICRCVVMQVLPEAVASSGTAWANRGKICQPRPLRHDLPPRLDPDEAAPRLSGSVSNWVRVNRSRAVPDGDGRGNQHGAHPQTNVHHDDLIMTAKIARRS